MYSSNIMHHDLIYSIEYYKIRPEILIDLHYQNYFLKRMESAEDSNRKMSEENRLLVTCWVPTYTQSSKITGQNRKYNVIHKSPKSWRDKHFRLYKNHL